MESINFENGKKLESSSYFLLKTGSIFQKSRFLLEAIEAGGEKFEDLNETVDNLFKKKEYKAFGKLFQIENEIVDLKPFIPSP